MACGSYYGSSRLGTKDYLPNQYYNLWDNQGPTIIVDTTQLNGRRPWYSLEYNDDIKGLYAEPWSNTDVSPFSVQHQVGQKQYELINHLGNVQATVTDLPVLAAKTNDTIRQHHPALAAAYDYYPFGMLMPDRYVSDTSGNCLTVTQTKWVTTYETVCHDVYDWVWPNISVIALGSFTFNTKELFFTAPRLTDGIAVSATVVPHLSHTLNLDLDLLQNEASTTRLQVTELIDGNWKEIASTSLVKGRNLVTFIPSTSTITWRILGPFYVKVNTVCITQPVLSQQSVLVDICNTDKDKYRFGFNGQEKVNEWAGIGNEIDFGARCYDSRIGRFPTPDPLKFNFPGYSPYMFAMNRPIDGVDAGGMKWVNVNPNNVGVVVFGTRNIYGINGEGMDRAIQMEFNNALHAGMNVIVAKNWEELEDDLRKSNTKFTNLYFGGHGGASGNMLSFFSFGYTSDELLKNAEPIRGIGSFTQNVVLLGCFEGIAKLNTGSNEADPTKVVDKVSARMTFATLIGKPIYSNKGYGQFNKMFNGGYQFFSGHAANEPDWIDNLNKNNWGWRVDYSNGKSKEFTSLSIQPDGSFTILDFKAIKGSLAKGVNAIKEFFDKYDNGSSSTNKKDGGLDSGGGRMKME